jgi:hypothetical protein
MEYFMPLNIMFVVEKNTGTKSLSVAQLVGQVGI